SIFELLDDPCEPPGGSVVANRGAAAIVYPNVCFSYPMGKGVALPDVRLSGAPGELVADVGRSRSGKSTLVILLPRFYEPDSGTILIDGRELRDYQLHSLRDQIAVVSQDVVLFNDTIRANTAFGREVTNEEIERAAEAALV